MQATISFRIKKEYKDALGKIANREGENISSIINEIIVSHLEYRQKIKRLVKIGEKEIREGKIYEENVWRKVFHK